MCLGIFSPFSWWRYEPIFVKKNSSHAREKHVWWSCHCHNRCEMWLKLILGRIRSRSRLWQNLVVYKSIMVEMQWCVLVQCIIMPHPVNWWNYHQHTLSSEHMFTSSPSLIYRLPNFVNTRSMIYSFHILTSITFPI